MKKPFAPGPHGDAILSPHGFTRGSPREPERAVAGYAGRIATSSTSKISVAPGGMTPPAPRSP
jgi:hypothetical protein